MKQLQSGEFHGQTNQTIGLDGIILTDTEYTHKKVDWHYHENAYFTFILQGKVLEGDKKDTHHCSPGSLLFHNWQEPHYNIKPEGYTRGFHIELTKDWFTALSCDISGLEGSFQITNSDTTILFYKIFKESKIYDNLSALSIQDLLLQVFAKQINDNRDTQTHKPSWVSKIKELLQDECCENHTLEELVKALGIHPVHLSRYFPKYFHCGVGDYIRKCRIEKSLTLLSNKGMTLTEIAFECGFADQSHFNRSFKEIMGVKPLVYKKLILC